MQITYATQAAPGGINEDFVVTGTSWVAVLDGATPRPGVASGCIHDVPWLVGHLGSSLADSLSTRPELSLADALAVAIATVCAEHVDTCDLTNPDSPSSTVALLRERGEDVEYLVLGDSPILLDTGVGLQAVTDDRSAGLPSYTAESVRSHRNQPHGFWIASTRPEAARHAVTGSVPQSGLSSAAVLTDGISRFVDRVGLGSWDDLFKLLHDQGPVAVIAQIREAERSQLPNIGEEPNGRRVKRHDDATAVLVRL